jgi:exopolysaccharide biosynthesis protein
VRNGRVLAGNVDGTTPFHRRNPRTGVGATADGRLLLVTVDGRQPGHSVGLSLRGFAELFVLATEEPPEAGRESPPG